MEAFSRYKNDLSITMSKCEITYRGLCLLKDNYRDANNFLQVFRQWKHILIKLQCQNDEADIFLIYGTKYEGCSLHLGVF